LPAAEGDVFFAQLWSEVDDQLLEVPGGRVLEEEEGLKGETRHLLAEHGVGNVASQVLVVDQQLALVNVVRELQERSRADAVVELF
jgi:hypothetical protein